jgi:flagellar biosynthesis/type III secretory pathway M-ring protein FliF/YscJ
VSLVVAILTLVLLAVVLLVVSAPLRAAQRRGRENAGAPTEPDRGGADLERDELEAAREAKYREIRDAELDYRTGKLSREDYESIDRALRAEALEILNRLETSGG